MQVFTLVLTWAAGPSRELISCVNALIFHSLGNEYADCTQGKLVVSGEAVEGFVLVGRCGKETVTGL